jgi:hypothetical protein
MIIYIIIMYLLYYIYNDIYIHICIYIYLYIYTVYTRLVTTRCNEFRKGGMILQVCRLEPRRGA